MDIDNRFPSMKNRPMAKEIKQMIIDSNLIFKEIDYDRVSKYLGEYMTIEEILDEEMEDLLYIEQDKLEKLKIVKQEKEKENNVVLETEKRGGNTVNGKAEKEIE